MKSILFLIPLLVFNICYSQDEGFFTFNSSKKYTQQDIDSIISIGRIDSKKKIEIRELKKMLESNSSLLGWTYYYLRKSSLKYMKREFDSVLYYAKKGIDLYNENTKAHNDSYEKDVLKLYYLKGIAFQELENYTNSISNYQIALDYSKKIPYKWKSFITTGIADNHLALGNDSLALKYYLRATKDSLFMSIPKQSIVTNTRIGVIYDVFEDFDNAKYYYSKALKQSNSTDYKGNLATIYGNLGSLLYNRNKTDSILYYYKKAISASEVHGIGAYDRALNYNEFYKSYIEVFEGSLEDGVRNLKKLIEDLKELETIGKNEKELMLSALNTLGIAYEKQGNSSEYQNLLDETFKFLNTFHEGQLKEDLQKLEIKYQTKEKDFSILQLEKNKTQQDTIIKQQKEITYGLGGFLILFSGLGYLFWRQQKLKNQYVTENLKQRLLRSQMNPHFIGNAMNTVSALVEKKSKNTIPYINKLSNLFRLILINSREEFVSLEDEITTIKSYLELQSNFSTVFDFNFLIDKNINHEEVIVPPMLIQPFVENAIIHGLSNKEYRGQINVEITKQDDKGLLLCTITDNGVSYKNIDDIKTSKKHTSVSGDIIKERLKILKRKFNVNSRVLIKKIDEGTKVELYLPFLIDD